MRVWPFTFACERDAGCLRLLLDSAARLGDDRLQPWKVFCDADEPLSRETIRMVLEHRGMTLRRLPRYAPWSESSAASKIDGFGQVASGKWGVLDEDFVVHVDSDCVLLDRRVLDALEGAPADFVGIDHDDRRAVECLGPAPWTWTSGAFQALRARVARRVAGTFAVDFVRDAVYDKMRAAGLSTVNDDVVVSFVAGLLRVSRASVSGIAGVGDLARAALGDRQGLALLHYASDRREFFGEEDCPKWEFPRVLHERGLVDRLLGQP